MVRKVTLFKIQCFSIVCDGTWHKPRSYQVVFDVGLRVVSLRVRVRVGHLISDCFYLNKTNPTKQIGRWH